MTKKVTETMRRARVRLLFDARLDKEHTENGVLKFYEVVVAGDAEGWADRMQNKTGRAFRPSERPAYLRRALSLGAKMIECF
jgi:hypothetical protein